MLNHIGPVTLFERATAQAARVLAGIRPDQLGGPTPCTEWTVQDLVEHMVGSTDHLLGATEATAGTFMDNLVHTWDLATATGQDRHLDDELVEACVAMFLPDMPERGRAGGIVGRAVAVPAGAPAQDRLLGAMGRHP